MHAEIQQVLRNYIHALYQGDFDAVYDLILRPQNKELFEEKRYPWTGSTSLGAYFIPATSSHYEWGIRLIRQMNK